MRNLTAKHAHKFNKAATYVDRKKQSRIDPPSDHDNYDPYLHLKHMLAERNGCSIHDITIEDHPMINETCIYIKNKWCGYVDLDQELD